MIDAHARIIIHPLFKKIRPFNWHPWKTLSSQGLFGTTMSGHSTDFFGFREYHPGDSLKTLYWKLTAKHRNKFFTKEFVQEQNASITLVVDARKNMDHILNGKSLLEYEINLAAALSEMFISQGNQVGLSIIGQKNGTLKSGYGKRQLHRILNGLAQTAIDDNNELYSNIASLNRRPFSSKTQFIFISPLHYDDIFYYRNLRYLGYQITLICPDILHALYPPEKIATNNPLRRNNKNRLNSKHTIKK